MNRSLKINRNQYCFGLLLHLIRFIALEKEKDFPGTIPLNVDFLEPETGNRVPVSLFSARKIRCQGPTIEISQDMHYARVGILGKCTSWA